jgi:predicted component of type VI protein secretion system
MAYVTFHVLEGVDKGRVFRDLPTPVTIGREEGNLLRLNDERVSRFHAKVQQDNGDIILTDLESTNGTRVNGTMVSIRRLRPGDQVIIGRTRLLYGTHQEIAERMATLGPGLKPKLAGTPDSLAFLGPATIQSDAYTALDPELDVELDANAAVRMEGGNLFIGQQPLPPLPQKMTPAQAARMAEILDFLHRGLTRATENIEADEDGTQVTLSYGDWQMVLAVQMLLARYLRAVTDPDSLGS